LNVLVEFPVTSFLAHNLLWIKRFFDGAQNYELGIHVSNNICEVVLFISCLLESMVNFIDLNLSVSHESSSSSVVSKLSKFSFSSVELLLCLVNGSLSINSSLGTCSCCC
jgi:hypothetical protein